MSVLVFAGDISGKISKHTYGIVSYARDLAAMTGDKVTAVATGKISGEVIEMLGRHGAGKIIVAAGDSLSAFDASAYCTLVSGIAVKEKSSVVIFSDSAAGKAIAPRLSVRLKAGMGSGVTGLPLSIDPFVVMKRAFSGNTSARLVINSPVKILTIRNNSYQPSENQATPETEYINVDEASYPCATVVRNIKVNDGHLMISDADIVVSGGRGMKSPENWKPLEELASLLGAATACTRPVSDEEHAGQTGKIIAPNLYIAVGISGAIQHMAGVNSSKCIVAINSDGNAPVFEMARYGIVGDAMKILPLLSEAVRKLRT
jgi:electron transfer flavoprotein alpha subunit